MLSPTNQLPMWNTYAIIIVLRTKMKTEKRLSLLSFGFELNGMTIGDGFLFSLVRISSFIPFSLNIFCQLGDLACIRLECHPKNGFVLNLLFTNENLCRKEIQYAVNKLAAIIFMNKNRLNGMGHGADEVEYALLKYCHIVITFNALARILLIQVSIQRFWVMEFDFLLLLCFAFRWRPHPAPSTE